MFSEQNNMMMEVVVISGIGDDYDDDSDEYHDDDDNVMSVIMISVLPVITSLPRLVNTICRIVAKLHLISNFSMNELELLSHKSYQSIQLQFYRTS